MGSKELSLDVGQALELKITLRRAGFEPKDVTKMVQDVDLCKGFRDVLRGRAKIEPVKQIIDCDVTPFVPDGWSIHPEDQIMSRVQGQLEFDPAKVKFYFDQRQKSGTINGYDLKRELEGKPVLNASILDYLLVNTNFILESWNVDEHGFARIIYFWGTIYRDSYGCQCVRCLHWDGGSRGRLCYERLDHCFVDRLDHCFLVRHSAALLAA